MRLSGPNPEGQCIMNFPPHIIALTHVVGSLDLGKEEGRVSGWGEGGEGAVERLDSFWGKRFPYQF